MHRIFVKVCESRNTAGDIRSFAESETEGFDEAYDYRETDSAGGWSDEYPENVIFGREKPNVLIDELNEVKDEQERTLKYHIRELKKDFPTLNLHEIIDSVTAKCAASSFTAYHLKCIAEALSGDYTFDSCFYDTTTGYATVDDGVIKKVEERPSEWALVLFDYHF